MRRVVPISARSTMKTSAWISMAAMLSVMISGCNDDDNDNGTAPATSPGVVRMHLDHMVDGVPLEMNVIQYTNDAFNTYSVKKLVYVVSDISLNSDSWSLAYDVVHMRDAGDPATRTITLEDVVPESYESISFTFGLDEAHNLDPDQGGTLPQTVEWEAFRWPELWGGGYHYMQLEGDVLNPVDPVPYRTHTGRRYARNDPTFGTDPAPFPHFFTVTIPTDGLDMGGGEVWDVTILMNVDRWYQDTDGAGPVEPYDLTDYLGGMMMNTAAQDLLEANGPDVFTLGGVSESQ